MALSKPSPLSILLTVIVFGYGIYTAWKSTDKTDQTSYTKGAQHTETTYTVAPVQNLYPLAFPGCSPFIRMDTPGGIKYPEVEKKVKK